MFRGVFADVMKNMVYRGLYRLNNRLTPLEIRPDINRKLNLLYREEEYTSRMNNLEGGHKLGSAVAFLTLAHLIFEIAQFIIQKYEEYKQSKE